MDGLERLRRMLEPANELAGDLVLDTADDGEYEFELTQIACDIESAIRRIDRLLACTSDIQHRL